MKLVEKKKVFPNHQQRYLHFKYRLVPDDNWIVSNCTAFRDGYRRVQWVMNPAIIKWCDSEFGQSNYYMADCSKSFYFHTEEDATLFIMRW